MVSRRRILPLHAREQLRDKPSYAPTWRTPMVSEQIAQAVAQRVRDQMDWIEYYYLDHASDQVREQVTEIEQQVRDQLRADLAID